MPSAGLDPPPSAPYDPAAPMSPVDLDALIQPVLDAPGSIAGQIGPELQQALAAVSANTGYIGRQTAVAAIAAAGLIATEPTLITEALTALAKGDVTGAVKKAVEAAAAPLRPPSIILDAVRTVADNHGAVPESSAAARSAAHRRNPASAHCGRGAQSASHLPRDTATRPSASANGGTDLADGNKVAPKPNRAGVQPAAVRLCCRRSGALGGRGFRCRGPQAHRTAAP